MKNLKYVIVKCEGREKAILFDEHISHCDVYAKSKIVSAGFCKFKLNKATNCLIIEVWGDSESLKIKGRKQLDQNLIFQTLQPGLWDYFMDPDDPLWDKIQDLINGIKFKI